MPTSTELIRYIILGIMAHNSFTLILLMLQSSQVTSDIPDLTICNEGMVTANSVQLNMDTSAIAGTTGSCQCNIYFNENTAFNISSQHITSPNYGTKILFSDDSFKHTCSDNNIPPISFARNVTAQLTIRVQANGSTYSPMSGIVHLRTDGNTNFTLVCYKTKVTRRTTASTVTTSTITTTSLTASTIATTSLTTTKTKTTLKTSTNGRSLSISTMTVIADTSIASGETTTKVDAQMITTQSNGTGTGVTKTEFPVALTAGCATGGVVLVGLVVVAVLICKRKSKKTTENCVKEYEASSFPKRDRKSVDDEYLSMENELYCSSGDVDIGSAIKPKDNPNVIGEKGKKKTVLSPNGDSYTLVDKPRNAARPLKRNVEHRTGPSGDMYTVVDKLK